MEKASKFLLDDKCEIFLMCCDLRSFSATAHALRITQSAVSKAISKLEQALGITLFARDSRPLALTPEAQLLKQHLLSINANSEKFFSNLKHHQFSHPVLRVGILESLHLNMGVAILEKCALHFTRIIMITASANVLSQRLKERKLDLIITNHIPSEASKCSHFHLFREPSVLIFPKDFKKFPKESWSWKRLKLCGLPLIRYWNETGAGEINETFLKENDLVFPEKISVDTNSLMLKLVYEGMGWAFTRPTSVLQNLYLLPGLCIAPMQQPLMVRDVYLIRRQDEFSSEAQWLSSICKESMHSTILPAMLKFAPWIKDNFSIS